MLNKDPLNNPKINTIQQTPTGYDLHPLLTALQNTAACPIMKTNCFGRKN